MFGLDDLERHAYDSITRDEAELSREKPALLREFGQDIVVVAFASFDRDEEKQRLAQLALKGMRPADRAKVQEVIARLQPVTSRIADNRQYLMEVTRRSGI